MLGSVASVEEATLDTDEGIVVVTVAPLVQPHMYSCDCV